MDLRGLRRVRGRLPAGLRTNGIQHEIDISMQKTGKFFRAFAPLLRLVFPLRERPNEEQLLSGAVYLCRHGNNAGPPYTFLYLAGQVRPWVYSVFYEEKACFAHTYRYTFLQRCGLPRPIAWLAARLSAFFAPKILRALNAIPVYRNGAQSMVTLRESVRALLGGDSILLFPDVNYTSENGEIGELYRGFLLLERMYCAKTGRHLPFVPIAVKPRRRIAIGRPVLFGDGDPEEQMNSVAEALRLELDRLEETA